MSPQIDEPWLCEVWAMPPEVECNGDGPRLEVMRYAGEAAGIGSGFTRRCGDVEYRMEPAPVQQLWIPAPGSDLYPGQPIWRVVPIRVLAPDVPAEDDVLVEWVP